MSSYDLIVIGSGPGGYTGAIRAAQLGCKTAVIEKYHTLGGTCLNVGCIPSKALLDSSEHYHFAQKDMACHGITASSISLDLTKMMNRKSRIVEELTQGIQYLFKKNRIDRFEGEGSFVSPHQVQIKSPSGTRTIEGKNIMLATGSKPRDLKNIPWDGKQVISSTEALSLTQVPHKMLVIGGGFIGLEMASVWSRLGSQVTVIEHSDRLCASLDQELSKHLLKILKQQGIHFILDSAIQNVQKQSSEVTLTYQSKDKKLQDISADLVLLAVGRRPYPDLLQLGRVNIKTDDRGFIPVNKQWRTEAHPHIFAVGDLIGGIMLAHKAEEEGVAVAEVIAQGTGHVNYDTIPSVIYTWPEVASVGQNEQQLKEQGISYHVGKFPFIANGRAKALGHTQGFVKILAEAQTDRVLGVHIIGPRASDLLPEAVTVMEFGGSSEDIARSIHAHPTLSEVMREAALAVEKRARQI